ncbi:uncharacterized protein LOC128040443 [Gossypium raimondii]|uniref:uncharacterized protein LOC128040443 n=1 Tax=Gossypium raimondii TaxID=29730 RepID=UPI00227CDF3D|nr:uncharacterized protein LOC128040443 [Gossypium raimondii]
MEGFSLIATPLTKLLRKGVPFDSINAEQESFEMLKTVLTEAPVLVQPKLGKEFTVYSDASYVDLECVLMQKDFITAFHPYTYGQSEWVIQILADMLRSCAIDFRGSWEEYLPLAEFAYDNSFQSRI